MKTAWEIADEWYKEGSTREGLLFRKIVHGTSLGDGAVPEDVRSPEFAHWLTQQLRIAMADGIRIGRAE